jgi:hypothetical protein
MAHKDTIGKLQMNLIPPRALEAVALVRTFGNNKYKDPWGWRDSGQVSVDQMLEAIKRHQNKLDRGEEIDIESGLPHVYHIACDAMMAAELLMFEKEKL